VGDVVFCKTQAHFISSINKPPAHIRLKWCCH